MRKFIAIMMFLGFITAHAEDWVTYKDSRNETHYVSKLVGVVSYNDEHVYQIKTRWVAKDGEELIMYDYYRRAEGKWLEACKWLLYYRKKHGVLTPTSIHQTRDEDLHWNVVNEPFGESSQTIIDIVKSKMDKSE